MSFITDIVMPGLLQGPELAINAHKLRSGLKVIFVTGYTEPSTLEDLDRVPPPRLLRKPFKPDTLLHEVRRALISPQS